MRLLILATLLSCLATGAQPAAAGPETEALAGRILAAITPPGAKISFAAAEGSQDNLTVRDLVAHGATAGGEEVVQRIGLLRMQGVQELPSGLFRAAKLDAENIRIDGAADLQTAKPGSIQIASLSVTNIDGARIGAMTASGIEISAFAMGSSYAIRIASASLNRVDAQSLSRAAVKAQQDPQSERRENALVSALLNNASYGAMQLKELSLRRDKTDLLTIAALISEADGQYAPFPASGKFSIRNASIDLRDPMTARLKQWLGQDRLQFSLESHHTFQAPGSHRWDSVLRLSPDAVLAGNCSAQNLNGFSPALIRQAQAASGNSATLRKCDLNFTGTEFVNRWLAQDGAKQGLNAEEARAKYLAGTLLVSLDPQTAGDPLAMQLASASQIFLSQPSRLNIQLAPPGGLKFPDGFAAIGLLFQGTTEQKQQAMHKLGLNVTAAPLN